MRVPAWALCLAVGLTALCLLPESEAAGPSRKPRHGSVCGFRCAIPELLWKGSKKCFVSVAPLFFLSAPSRPWVNFWSWSFLTVVGLTCRLRVAGCSHREILQTLEKKRRQSGGCVGLFPGTAAGLLFVFDFMVFLCPVCMRCCGVGRKPLCFVFFLSRWASCHAKPVVPIYWFHPACE